MSIRNKIRRYSRQILPISLRNRLIYLTRFPPVGTINFGSLRRIKPISQVWGLDRGQPVDRFYIEQFLANYSADICGYVLEIGDDKYTHKFGKKLVLKSDILHVSKDDPKATIVADLSQADHVPSNTFDCIICTQTLHLIYEVQAALKTLYRILKPEGVLLATVPGISQISRYDMDRWGDYWRFTSASMKRIAADVFPLDQIQIETYGNVLSSAAFLYGLAAGELSEQELAHNDPDYEMIIGIRAGKSVASG
jgi:SAM-dependent methyltransferase